MMLDGPEPLVDTREGWISARIFVDPEIYRLERERIFGSAWLYVAHESEIPRPGDFVTRYMGEDPVIVIRGADGQVRVLLNVCRHRGRTVCGEDAGRTASFRCGYHGWTYGSAGELTAVPFFEAYQGRLDKGALGLYAAPRVEAYRGLIFATWDAGAERLSDALGSVKWALDLLFGRTEAVEVAGPPMRWTTDANWKLGAANFAGDGYHLATTHGYGMALGLDPTRSRRGGGYAMATENGHTATLSPWTYAAGKPYLGLPGVLWPEMERQLTPAQRATLEPLMTVVGNVFPNCSFLNVATVGFLNTELPAGDGHESADAAPSISFLTLRLWQPRGPDKMEVWSWLFMDRNAPAWWKAASRACYLRAFGPAGTHEQDDMENWACIGEGLRGPVARRLRLVYRMRLGGEPLAQWPGPGTAYAKPGVDETSERAFYARWLACIRGEPADAPRQPAEEALA
jgi:nitrite reductase/ring-hydroxylating ferredoxin subunit